MGKVIILYATKSGNTEKVAKSLEEELNCPALKLTGNKSLNKIDLKDYDCVMLGTGVYADKPHKDLIDFIDTIDSNINQKFGLFFTWLGRGDSSKKAFEICKKKLKEKNQIVLDDYFQCYGKGFYFIRKDRPNELDLKNASKWARKIVEDTK